MSNKSEINNLRHANTSLLEYNKQLKVADTKLRDFINIAAHELRTPIMPILCVLELAESDFEKHRGKNEIVLTKQQFQSLKSNANRLERLASNILDFAKIENNTLPLHKDQFSLIDIISGTKQEFQRGINRPNKKVDLIFRVYTSDQQQKRQKFIINADKIKIIQVIHNILENALKFAESKVYISIQRDCNDAVVCVKDDGNGIDDKIMSRLFTRYVTSTSSQGTGLGLFISRVIIEAHHGRIWAENDSDKNNKLKGATFG